MDEIKKILKQNGYQTATVRYKKRYKPGVAASNDSLVGLKLEIKAFKEKKNDE